MTVSVLTSSDRVLEFDVSTSLLLLSSHSANTHSTLLVDISITLLGNNPSITDRSHTDFFASDNEKISNGPTNREPLRLHRGEWVCVVGWLEGEGSGIVKKVGRYFKALTYVDRVLQINLPDNYDSPIPIILECIYIVPSRAPLQNGLVRGEITPWDGTRQVDGPAVDQEEDTTPRPRKKR